MTTSFVKKTNTRGRPPLPYGTKPSLSNNQLLVSTGIPSLDTYIGGGIAVGTLILIDEDEHNTYTKVVHKLFLAEGVKCKQSLFLAKEEPYHFLKEIPCAVDEIQQAINSTNKVDEKKNQDNNEELKIAWRYQNQPKVQKPLATQFGHYYDLSQPLSDQRIEEISCTCFCPFSEQTERLNKKNNPKYVKLLKEIQNKIENEKLYTENSKSVPPILRIDIQSIGSPLWNEGLITSKQYDPALAWFLLALRALLRKSYATCMVSIPTQLFENECYIKRIWNCCDVVVKLESFDEFEKNPLYKEYNGFVHVKKLPSLNCINGQNIDTSDLAFKLKRRKFLIEKFHLPPDISETVSRSQGNTSTIKAGAPLCSSTTPVNDLLDF